MSCFPSARAIALQNMGETCPTYPCYQMTSYFNEPECGNISTCPPCDNQEGLFWVETWWGQPGASGSSGISAVSLKLCDALQFWSQGTMYVNAQQGSVQLRIEATNIISGVGAPVSPPSAPDFGFLYHDNSNPTNVWIWNPSTAVWIQAAGAGSGGLTGYKGNRPGKVRLAILDRRGILADREQLA